jgi:hypothetical protein
MVGERRLRRMGVRKREGPGRIVLCDVGGMSVVMISCNVGSEDVTW